MKPLTPGEASVPMAIPKGQNSPLEIREAGQACCSQVVEVVVIGIKVGNGEGEVRVIGQHLGGQVV